MRCFPAARRAAFGLALLLVACSDDPTGPPPPTAAAPPAPVEQNSVPEPPATGAIAAERAVAVAVEDALERVLPMLGGEGGEGGIANLAAALTRLAESLEAGDGAAVTRAASQAHRAIAVLGDRFENVIEARVHLDVVDLVIARARELEFPADLRSQPGPPNEEEHHGR